MSILNIQYHLSDARSEPVSVRRASSPRPRPQPPVVENDHALYQFSPLDDDFHYSPPRRVLSRGEMEDGSIAVNHPAVERYLRCLKGSLQVSESWHRGSPMGWPWHTSDGRCMTWWHAEKAGIVRSGDPWSVCHRSVEGTLDMVGLQRSTIKALFALAALAVMRTPRDSVFWAFWGLKSAERTAELVDEVIRKYLFHLRPEPRLTCCPPRHLPTAHHPSAIRGLGRQGVRVGRHRGVPAPSLAQGRPSDSVYIIQRASVDGQPEARGVCEEETALSRRGRRPAGCEEAEDEDRETEGASGSSAEVEAPAQERKYRRTRTARTCAPS